MKIIFKLLVLWAYAMVVIVGALFTARDVHAGEWFTKLSGQDQAREAVFVGLVALDFAQSVDIKRHAGMYEINPLVVAVSGKNPTDGEFAAWCLGTVLLHAAVAYALPETQRHWFQYITIGVEGVNVARNFSIGLRVKL